MLDSIRSFIGVAPPPSPVKRENAVLARKREEASSVPHIERLTRLARAQDMQMEALRDELADVTADLGAATKAKNASEMRTHLTRKKELEGELLLLSKKRTNTNAQLRTHNMADANLDQALLVEEGAHELQATVDAMETIDLEAAVGKLQDAALEVEEHNHLLTEPLIPGSVAVDDEVDEELQALLRQQQELDDAILMSKLPNTPAGVKHTTTPVTPQMRKEIDETTK